MLLFDNIIHHTDYDMIVGHGQIYRFFLYPITFAYTDEVLTVFGLLVQLMRRFEREVSQSINSIVTWSAHYFLFFFAPFEVVLFTNIVIYFKYHPHGKPCTDPFIK